MRTDPYDSAKEKVIAIFKELAGLERELQLRDGLRGHKIHTTIASAISSNMKEEVADEIAFHMVDWSSDAAFIVAVHLFPERFTAEEIDAGIGVFLAHAPSHIVAAARMMGLYSDDVFDEGDHDKTA